MTLLQQVAQGVQAVSDLRAAVGGGKDAGIVRMASNSTTTAAGNDNNDGFGTLLQRSHNGRTTVVCTNVISMHMCDLISIDYTALCYGYCDRGICMCTALLLLRTSAGTNLTAVVHYYMPACTYAQQT
jgi:hypothetical protein